jgi:hypothetical protein
VTNCLLRLGSPVVSSPDPRTSKRLRRTANPLTVFLSQVCAAVSRVGQDSGQDSRDDQCACTLFDQQTKDPRPWGRRIPGYKSGQGRRLGHSQLSSAFEDWPCGSQSRARSVGILSFVIMASASAEDGDVPADASSGRSRPRPIRYISPAALNLHRVYEQNRQRLQKKDGAKVPDPTAPQTKGKPRLLLMGQRR